MHDDDKTASIDSRSDIDSTPNTDTRRVITPAVVPPRRGNQCQACKGTGLNSQGAPCKSCAVMAARREAAESIENELHRWRRVNRVGDDARHWAFPDPEIEKPPGNATHLDWLAYLNAKYAVVGDLGGKCRVIGWRAENGRLTLYHQSLVDFRNRFLNQIVKVPGKHEDDATKSQKLGHWWLTHPKARHYDNLVFDPQREHEFDGCLNLWQGFGVAPKAGDWTLMQRHILEVLADGNENHADYILKWAAWCVQNPGKQAEVALAFRGGQGTGKGTFARALAKLFGQHSVHLSSSKQLTGNFNAHLRDCAFLFADEAIAPQDYEAVAALKALITEPSVRLESKGVDSIEWPNRLKIVMAANGNWVVPAEYDDRRFVVFDVSEQKKEDRAWFKPLVGEMEQGGLAAMLYDLLRLDLDEWHPRYDRPQTQAHTDQKIQSLGGIERIWLECLQTGSLPTWFRKEKDGSLQVQTSTLLAKWRKNSPRLSYNRVATLLVRPQSNDRNSRRGMDFEKYRSDGRATSLLVIPPLAEARKRWDERRFKVAWDESDAWVIEPV